MCVRERVVFVSIDNVIVEIRCTLVKERPLVNGSMSYPYGCRRAAASRRHAGKARSCNFPFGALYGDVRFRTPSAYLQFSSPTAQ